MDALSALVSSGRAVDLVVALMVLEFGALAIYHRATGRGVAPAKLAANMLAGLALLLALRAALTGMPAYWVALFLVASLGAHLVDLALRWRS
jgi:hypothetical protein